ncbi:hypothetical protein SMSP2_02449 [Limihaloglobus sulfuriphilus]|uniref:Uncharacterized protein n=1 Tax=Limihaloglobus sulfuriphilus TaxID=1851148 RepID=A0A1Q2MHE4_9BACT|nr:hypothetical protein [Limihaloglobus sulfuriphilus]AQQ72069.1 hypothetical protein SMSP2_02449 [Limihaloglobus sulfuriphilus]
MSISKITALITLFACSFSLAVNSNINRFDNPKALDGETEMTVIDSEGTISLGMDYSELFSEFEDSWSINCISEDGSGVYVGTSPNGIIYYCGNEGELKTFYRPQAAVVEEENKNSSEEEKPAADEDAENGSADSENDKQPQDAKPVADVGANLHIFAIKKTSADTVLAGISGNECKLLEISADGNAKELYDGTSDEAKYIFDIEQGPGGEIYMATGPTGKIIKLAGGKSSVVYTAQDNNIISLCLKGSKLYAGSDTRGILYCVNLKDNSARIIYDSDHTDITDIIVVNDDIYISSTGPSQQQEMMYQLSAQEQAAQQGSPQGPAQEENFTRAEYEPDMTKQERIAAARSALKEMNGGTSRQAQRMAMRRDDNGGGQPSPAGGKSGIVRIMPNGLTDMVYSDGADIFAIAADGNDILAAAGTANCELLRIDPAGRIVTTEYKDKTSMQITALLPVKDGYILGTSNPAKIISVSRHFAATGTYTSSLIDAGQPSLWGTISIDADIPDDCQVSYSVRTGNVNDQDDDAAFGEWSEPAVITKQDKLEVPAGRFAQYRLLLKGSDDKTPKITETTISNVFENLPPRVANVGFSGTQDPDIVVIRAEAADPNNDKLLYTAKYSLRGSGVWITIKEDWEEPEFKWNTKTVPDGIVQVRVVASDRLDNNAATSMTGYKDSEAVMIDNTAPVVESIEKSAKDGVVTIALSAVDNLTNIKKVEYNISGQDKWNAVIPDDLIFDTVSEKFTIKTEKLDAGNYVITLKISDAAGNELYKSIMAEVAGESK